MGDKEEEGLMDVHTKSAIDDVADVRINILRIM